MTMPTPGMPPAAGLRTALVRTRAVLMLGKVLDTSPAALSNPRAESGPGTGYKLGVDQALP